MIVALPFLLLRLVFKLLVFTVVAPLVILASVFAVIVAIGAILLAVLVPFIPFALIALLIWAIVRSSRPAYV